MTLVRLDDVDLLIVVAVAFGLSSASPFFGAMWILGVISGEHKSKGDA